MRWQNEHHRGKPHKCKSLLFPKKHIFTFNNKMVWSSLVTVEGSDNKDAVKSWERGKLEIV